MPDFDKDIVGEIVEFIKKFPYLIDSEIEVGGWDESDPSGDPLSAESITYAGSSSPTIEKDPWGTVIAQSQDNFVVYFRRKNDTSFRRKDISNLTYNFAKWVEYMQYERHDEVPKFGDEQFWEDERMWSEGQGFFGTTQDGKYGIWMAQLHVSYFKKYR